MTRRQLIGILGAAAAWAADAVSTVRGKLTAGKPARIESAAGPVELDGDGPTLLVLGDSRLNGFEFEANGAMTSPGKFRVDPIHKRNMFVHQDGKRLMISYWCSVCSIRTWQPGTCLCCQDETELSLGESFETIK